MLPLKEGDCVERTLAHYAIFSTIVADSARGWNKSGPNCNANMVVQWLQR